ncbi:MAG: YidC/Oxa1 family membrane protein insertase, partial [Clostridia bacterium]|nr:YidC/Oxa1 family membrane protein insertase [Clostridia bacterium]
MTGFFENLLTGIYSFVGNYGWAVIIFSIAIKAVLLPLDIKSRKSMRAMSQLSPKMEALKKRYANDQEKLNQKMGELYRKNKVNPLSGCLPMLIQLPILFIMFAAMRNIAAELQLQQMFDWVKDNFVDGDKWMLLTTGATDWNVIREAILAGKELTAEQNQIVELFLKNSDLMNIAAEDAKILIDSFATADFNTAIWDQLIAWTRNWDGIRAEILAGTQADTLEFFLKSDNDAVMAFIDGLRNGTGAEVFSGNSWLWVKNVFQPDSFSKTTVLTQSELGTMLSQYSKKIGDKNMLALLKLYSANAGDIAAAVDSAIFDQCGYKTFNLFFNMLPVK